MSEESNKRHRDDNTSSCATGGQLPSFFIESLLQNKPGGTTIAPHRDAETGSDDSLSSSSPTPPTSSSQPERATLPVDNDGCRSEEDDDDVADDHRHHDEEEREGGRRWPGAGALFPLSPHADPGGGGSGRLRPVAAADSGGTLPASPRPSSSAAGAPPYSALLPPSPPLQNHHHHRPPPDTDNNTPVEVLNYHRLPGTGTGSNNTNNNDGGGVLNITQSSTGGQHVHSHLGLLDHHHHLVGFVQNHSGHHDNMDGGRPAMLLDGPPCSVGFPMNESPLPCHGDFAAMTSARLNNSTSSSSPTRSSPGEHTGNYVGDVGSMIPTPLRDEDDGGSPTTQRAMDAAVLGHDEVKSDVGAEVAGDDGKKRPRTAFSADQVRSLEQEFQRSKYLSVSKRTEMSRQLGLTEQQIKIWFQNRRTKWKRKYTNNLEILAQQHYLRMGLLPAYPFHHHHHHHPPGGPPKPTSAAAQFGGMFGAAAAAAAVAAGVGGGGTVRPPFPPSPHTHSAAHAHSAAQPGAARLYPPFAPSPSLPRM